MRIHRIRIANYRGTAEREIRFGPGVTVVEGRNEIGKSSLAEALDLIFQYPDSSKAKPVTDVFPRDRDASPEIEVELETGPYRLTYRKRFGRGAATELEITRPRPENATGRAAHERARQVLAESLDEGLWRALQIQQGAGLEQAKLADSRALAKALDVASGGGGGPAEHAALFERARAEYERYFTPTGRERAEVAEARRRVDERRERVAKLEEEQRALEADVERSARLAAELRRLEEEAPRREAEAEQRRREWEEVARIRRALEQAEAELEQARRALRAAEEELARRRELEQRIEDARRALAEHESRRSEEEAAVEAAGRALEEAQERVREAKRAREEAERCLALRRGDVELRRNELDAQLLGERFDRVQEMRHRRREAERVLETNRLDADALQAFQSAEFAAREAEARLRESGPRLEVKGLGRVRIELGAETFDLAPGQVAERTVTERTVLRLPGALEIAVAPGASLADLEAAREKAVQKRDALRERYGVASLEEAIAAREAHQRATRDRAEAERRIREELRDLTLDALETKRDRCRAAAADARARRPPEPPLPATLEDAKGLLEAAEGAHREAAEVLARAEQDAEQKRARFEALRQEHAHRRGQIEQAAAQVQTLAQYLAAEREKRADDALEAAVAAAREAFSTTEARVRSLGEALGDQNPERVDALYKGAEAARAQVREDCSRLRVELATVNGRLETQQERGLFEALERERARLEHAEAELSSLARRAQAAQLLHETLSRHRDAARRSYLAPLRARIEGLGRVVFGPSFSVTLGDDLRVAERTLDGATLPFESLSKGAQEQLGLLARLAVAMTVSEDEGVPLLLDDALGHSDPQRLAGIAATLGQVAQGCQVILMTCSPERFRGIPGAQVERLAE